MGAKEIEAMHKARTPPFATIGYHFVIRTNGVIEYGRPVSHIGAHVEGHNAKSIGICLIGGLNSSGKPAYNFTSEQQQSLKLLVSILEHTFPNVEILGHRDFPNVAKDCPCFDVKHWLRTGQFINERKV